MPRIFKHLEADCLQVNLMSTSAQINQLKYTILYYTILSSNYYKVLKYGMRLFSLYSENNQKSYFHCTVKIMNKVILTVQ